MKDVPGIERSGLFQYLNMNKLGVTLNPETTTGKKIFGDLLKNADIFVENNLAEKNEEARTNLQRYQTDQSPHCDDLDHSLRPDRTHIKIIRVVS